MKWLLIFLFLSGCTVFNTPFHPEFYRENPPIVEAVVYTEAQMDSLCGGPMPRGKRLGCARIPQVESSPCLIVYYYNGSEETIEHEKNHCRYGRWHD